MTCVLDVVNVYEQVAVPPETLMELHSVLLSVVSTKLTAPAGDVEPEGVEVSVAVNRTDVFAATPELAPDVSARLVVAALVVTVALADVLPLKFASVLVKVALTVCEAAVLNV